MDQQNDDFESFLRQFQLRKPGPLSEPVSARRRRSGRWLFAAAAIASAVVLAAVFVWDFAVPGHPYATVEAAGDSLFKNGETIAAGRRVHAGAGEGMVLVLEDGTRVEMRTQSELMLGSAADGVRVQLNGGSIIVNAAPQRTGRLYVETRDIVASVLSTVFLVHAEQAGTRVAVIQGEVQVQQGGTSKTLAAGERMATDPALESQSIIGDLAWSRNLGAHIALLEQSAPVRPAITDDARQEPGPRGVTPIKVAPIVVPQISVAPIGVTPIAPVEAFQGQGGGNGARQPAAPPQPQQNPLPAGPIRDTLERSCSACHSLDVVWAQRFSSRQEIVELINRYINKGPRISESEATELVDYLAANSRRKKK